MGKLERVRENRVIFLGSLQVRESRGKVFKVVRRVFRSSYCC